MQSLAEHQYDKDDEEQRKAEYLQALKIQREQENNSIHLRVAIVATREEKQARREKNMAELAKQMAEFEAIDEPTISHGEFTKPFPSTNPRVRFKKITVFLL